jgi:hypothetical protein
MGLVGCYDLHVYCDDPQSGHKCTAYPGEYTGRTEAEAKRAARAAGWLLTNGEGFEGSGRAICPKHRKAA